MSAAALARWGSAVLFVKRHHPRVRSARQLATEHALADHLASQGVPVPRVLRAHNGQSVVHHHGFLYEVHTLAPGNDIYRDALSWSPFSSPGHAFSAGAALARFHRATASFPAPARPFGVLMTSTEVVTSESPLQAVARLRAQRPGLAGALAGRPVEADLATWLLPFSQPASALLRRIAPWWGHGDWHASNLTWTLAGPGGTVAGIFDLGLSNRTYAVHDLALAIERNCIDWLDLAEDGEVNADHAAAAALVRGYQEVRPLSPEEAAALVAVLPVCHVEHALSEVEYFADVVGSADEAGLAYEEYLLGHLRWFSGRQGQDLLRSLPG
jgi:Ser/Thr protein kinase RdoA (MazF antagonist)